MKRIVLVLLWLCLAVFTPAYADDVCGTIDTALVRKEVDTLHPELARAVIKMFVAQYECEHGDLASAIRWRDAWSKELILTPIDSPKYAHTLRIYRRASARVEQMIDAIIDAVAEPP